MIGKTLSHFKITAKLGEGGMGEVYRARDAKLDRDVALKVLPELFTSNPERLARFEREAKVLASLNHPNIAHIYGLEDGGATKALVLELVEGPTLADRIDQSPIPLAEAVDIARQIAEALEAAHEQGIIHRDLKPANVKVRPDGTVKVLDFGLAKAVEPEPEGELGLTQTPTLTSPATRLGVIMGTAAYMAPEQAEGKVVDARADLFAFGCVLYEMVTGRLAFGGDSVADTLSRVLHDEPRPAGEIVPTLAPRLAWVLEKCLAKNPADRYQSAGDLVVDLRSALAAREADSGVAAPVGSRPRSWRSPVLAVAAAAAVLIGGLLLGRGLKPDSEAPTRRFEILTMDLQPLSPGGGRLIGVSRDGMRVAYVDRGQIFVRDLSRDEAEPLAGSNLGVTPFFSPDGGWLVYTSTSARVTRKVWLESGESFEICSVAAVFGGAWGEDDTVVLSDGSSLWKVPAGGDSCRPLSEDQRDPTHAYRAPQFLPGGQELLVELFERGGAGGPKPSAAIVSASTGELLDVVVRDAGSPLYVETGHLLFQRGRTMFAQRFDPRSRTTTGEPIPVVDDVGFAYLAHLDVSADGTLVYVPARAKADLELVWVDRDGREDRLPVQPASYWIPRLSPGGDRLAVTLARSGQIDLAIVDLGRATVEPFAQKSFWPAWTPDGKKLAFVSNRELPASLWWQDLEGGGAAERIVAPPKFGYFVLSASVDPVVFTFYELRGPTARDILVMRPGEDPITLVATPGEDYAPRLSADARYLAYVTDTSGRDEVYVRTCPPCRPDLQLTERVWRVSLNGGTAPVWSRDGKEIFYLEGRNMMAVRVRTDTGFASEPPELLFESTHLPGQFGNPNYDVGPDGRFIMVKGAGSGASRYRINVVVNWFEELNERVALIR